MHPCLLQLLKFCKVVVAREKQYHILLDKSRIMPQSPVLPEKLLICFFCYSSFCSVCLWSFASPLFLCVVQVPRSPLWNVLRRLHLDSTLSSSPSSSLSLTGSTSCQTPIRFISLLVSIKNLFLLLSSSSHLKWAAVYCFLLSSY